MLQRLRTALRCPVERQSSKPDPIFADDTFIVSYPRSGNSWLRRLIAAALYPQTAWGVQNIDDVVHDMYTVGSRLAQYPRPRIIKSHESWQAFYPKVVYLYRDGRDVAVSYYDYYRTRWRYEGTFEQFSGLFVAGDVHCGRWDAHVRSWMFREHLIPFLALSYESLHEDARRALTAVMRFLGREVSEAAVAAAIGTYTFDAHVDDIRRHSPHYKTGYTGGVKGAPGQWREVLSGGQQVMFWDAMGRTMEDLGYSRLWLDCQG